MSGMMIKVRIAGKLYEMTDAEYERYYRLLMDGDWLRAVEFKGMKAGEECFLVLRLKEGAPPPIPRETRVDMSVANLLEADKAWRR